ncbi:MAG: metallophosphoesterase [Flavobacteriaceae bacterium]|nr:metallophosphoesterase [Flavobacteriaceae bacterium]
MRSYSIYMILLLCLTLFVIDALAFYWLRSITQYISIPYLKTVIHVLFWFFTIGLITAIIILKVRLDKVHPGRRQVLISSLYGLTISSFIPKFIFIIVISILYYTQYAFSDSESVIIIPVIALFSGFLPFFVILYGIFRSLYRFKVHHIKVPCKVLPESMAGLRIVQISDIHLGSFNYRYHILDRAISLINHLKPDFIFFTGDLVNNYAWELKGWAKIFKQLKAKKGKYAVLGNHDYGDYSTWKTPELKQANLESIQYFFKKIDFKLLLNEAEVFDIGEDQLAIIGVENWGNPPFKQYGDLQKAVKDVKHLPFKILLSHDPTHWAEEVIKDTDISLTLSGHTHGMQAGINLKNKKWSPIKYKYEHWAGLHKIKNQYLYVNRGLGWLGFPGRLGMRPEITSIDLEKQK